MSRSPPAPKNSITSDKLFVTWLNCLNEKTASRYRYGLIAYCEHTRKTCTQLIDDAREDYLNRVAPWDLRHVKAFEGFIQGIKGDPGISNWTKLGFINAVRHFYEHNKIPVPKVKHNIPAMATERYLDIPVLKLEDIRKAVLSCGIDEKLTKTLILTFLSSGQGQAEVQKLQGRHLKNLVNGVVVVNMTRGKTNHRYTFFIGPEALQAIKEYKPIIGDNDLVFTAQNGKKLYDTYIGTLFDRLADKLGWERSYFQPHRFRHYFKSQLSGSMDGTFIEYLLGHKLHGVESNYFLGNQDKMLEQYVKNQDKLTIFTPHETLLKQYDELKQQKDGGMSELKARIEQQDKTIKELIEIMKAKQPTINKR